MKKLITLCIILLSFACANTKSEKQIVELSCGQCQFGLTTQDGCDLAARIDGKAYFVDGADIDDYGDAHDKEIGFCEAVRKAEVEGEVVEGRFKVSSVKMLDE
jgi:hypothetical protein